MVTKIDLITFEKNIASKYENGEIPYPVHFSGGNEDSLIDIFKEHKKGDYVISTHRSHYHYLLSGGKPERLEEMILNGKSIHIADRKLNFLSTGIVAGGPSIAAGIALGLKKNNSKNKVFCFIGDGAEDEGHFYEAVRYVEGHNLPCKFIIEDNNRSVETPKEARYGKSEMIWPSCVTRYNFSSNFPHVGTGKFVNVGSSKINFAEKSFPKKITLDESIKFNGTYKEALQNSMDRLALDEKIIFLGYNTLFGSKAYGTLSQVNPSKILETPLAENLMIGLAMGLSIEGYKPVVFFERHDFLLNALDGIVNHLDKFEQLTDNQFKVPVVIRANVGAKTPLYPGVQHIQNYTESLKKMISLPIYEPNNPSEILQIYEGLKNKFESAIIIEHKEKYGNNGELRWM